MLAEDGRRTADAAALSGSRSRGFGLHPAALRIRACQLLLGHRKRESTVRHLGVEVDDALELSEQIDL